MNTKRALAERIDKVNEAVEACRLRLNRENIHALRVGIRRLHAALRLCKPAIGKHAVKEIRRPTKSLLKLAGRVRDCDVADVLARDAGFGRLHRYRAELAKERKVRAEALKRAIARSPEIEVPEIAAKRIALDPDLFDDFLKAGERATARPTVSRLHALRIEGKKVRYTMELTAPKDRRVESLKELQQVLGLLNDCESTRRQFPNATLNALLAAAIRRYRHEFLAMWKRIGE